MELVTRTRQTPDPENPEIVVKMPQLSKMEVYRNQGEGFFLFCEEQKVGRD